MRSSGIPRRRGLGGMTRIISARSSPTTIKRPTSGSNSLGGKTNVSTDEHSESLWAFDPTESVGSELVGERLDGALNALAVASDSVDLQQNDITVHGGVEYEIDTIVGHPYDGETDGTASPETDFWIVSFTRRQ